MIIAQFHFGYSGPLLVGCARAFHSILDLAYPSRRRESLCSPFRSPRKQQGVRLRNDRVRCDELPSFPRGAVGDAEAH
jgi:hypothetical protein